METPRTPQAVDCVTTPSAPMKRSARGRLRSKSLLVLRPPAWGLGKDVVASMVSDEPAPDPIASNGSNPVNLSSIFASVFGVTTAGIRKTVSEPAQRQDSKAASEGSGRFENSAGPFALDPAASPFLPTRFAGPKEAKHVTYKQFKQDLEFAQQIFSSRDAIFVGNLPQEFDNLDLTMMVIESFGEFGQVFGIVRRSVANKPYAILQYPAHDGASLALAFGSTIEVAGRRCRVSHSNANKAIHMSKVKVSFAMLQTVGPCKRIGGGHVRFERYGDFLAARNAGMI